MNESTYKWSSFFIKLISVLLIGISFYMLYTKTITLYQLTVYLLLIVFAALGSLLIIWIFYKLFLEKHHFALKRKWTEKLLTSDFVPSEIAVIGERRGGKDSLACGLVKYNADAFYFEIEKRLKDLRNNTLYIFDFRKLHKFLDSKMVKNEFIDYTSNELRHNFKRVFYNNRAFLKGRYMKKYCGPSRKLAVKFIKNKPSGIYFNNKVRKIDFFSILMEYIELYIRIYVIGNMVITNQPFMELIEELDNEDLAAKKLSYDYFKIKEKPIFPWVRYLLIFDTEATLYWNNSDKTQDNDNKQANGVLEFFIGKGQFLKKFKYVTTIQEDDRAQAWYRGLFELKIFLHQKLRMVSTSPIKRFLKRFKRGSLKVINILLLKWIGHIKIQSIIKKGISRAKSKILKWILHLVLHITSLPMKYSEKRIYTLTEQENVLLMRSKLEFEVVMKFRNKGDSYSTKSLYSLVRKNYKQENVKTQLVFDILDIWPYYSTEHLGDAGDTMKEHSEIKFSKIPSWPKNLHFDLYKDGAHLNHKLYNTIINTLNPTKSKKRNHKK